MRSDVMKRNFEKKGYLVHFYQKITTPMSEISLTRVIKMVSFLKKGLRTSLLDYEVHICDSSCKRLL